MPKADEGWQRHNPQARLLIHRSHTRVPVAVAVARDVDLPRLTAHRAVLYVRLARRAAVIDVELGGLAAVRAGYGKEFSHFWLILCVFAARHQIGVDVRASRA